MYTNTEARVISPDGETELFDITAGVLQGDTLAPFLFIIVLDHAMRQAELATLMRDRGIWHGHVVGRRQATK